MNEERKHITVSVSTGTIIKVVAVALCVLALYYMYDVLLIILTAIVLASAIEPETRWLVRRGLPRIVAVILIYLFLFAVVFGVVYLALPSFLKDVGDLVNTLPQHISTVSIGETNNNLSRSLGEAVQNVANSLSGTSNNVLGLLASIFGGISSFFIVAIISFYLSVQENGIEEFLRLVTPLKHEKYIITLWRRTQYKIGRWLQGQMLLALFVGLLVFIGLSLLGVKNALLLALISVVFEIIPVFGPIIAAIPGILIAFLQGGMGFALIVGLMYAVIQQIESNFVYPLVVKKVVNVHPLVVIIALIVGAKLGGILGILLSVPVATALTEFMTDIIKRRTAARELSTDTHE